MTKNHATTEDDGPIQPNIYANDSIELLKTKGALVKYPYISLPISYYAYFCSDSITWTSIKPEYGSQIRLPVVCLLEYFGILDWLSINLVFGGPKCGHNGFVFIRNGFTGCAQGGPGVPVGVIIRLLHVIDRIPT